MRSEEWHLTAKQIHRWDEAVEEDVAAVDLEVERLNVDKIDLATHQAQSTKLVAIHLNQLKIELWNSELLI